MDHVDWRVAWMVGGLLVLGLWAAINPKSFDSMGRRKRWYQREPLPPSSPADLATTRGMGIFYLMVGVAVCLALAISMYVRSGH